ncbi:MAG: LPS export ABC transporter periplasmic protein LptC [Gammaproteobacteria bacterium]|nr:MAG: LPS export ABC transporter periplasmic protein LptC [Gammaproteobacteria bacterium]
MSALLLQPRTWLIMLTVAAAITWWIVRNDEPREALPVATDTTPTGFYMRGARLIGLGEDGQVLYRLHAAFGTQTTEDEPIALSEVTVDYAPTAEVPWRIEGGQAEVTPDRAHIRLFGGVVATSTGNTQPPAVIRSASLALDTETQIASTRDEVHIETPEGSLQGVGMTAWLREDRLRLESRVHGTFTP